MAQYFALIILTLCAFDIKAQEEESCLYSVTVPRSQLVTVGDCSGNTVSPLEAIKTEMTELVRRENSRLEDQMKTMTAILRDVLKAGCKGESGDVNTINPKPIANVVIPPTLGCSKQCREAITACRTQTEDPTATECIITCPEITCLDGSGRSVWGTDQYTDDSSICRSAVHAGVIGASGGSFKVIKARGLSSYDASIRNGISTHGYGSWSGSCRYEAV